MSIGAIIIGTILLLIGVAIVIGVLYYLGKERKVEPYVSEREDNTPYTLPLSQGGYLSDK